MSETRLAFRKNVTMGPRMLPQPPMQEDKIAMVYGDFAAGGLVERDQSTRCICQELPQLSKGAGGGI